MGSRLFYSPEERKKQRLGDYLLVKVLLVVGYMSLFAFLAFLLTGPFRIVVLGWSDGHLLAFNIFISLAFFAQHSGMIRESFRKRMENYIEDKYSGAVFTISSGITLIVFVILWQEVGRPFLSAQGGLRWFLCGLFFTALSGSIWGARSLGKLDMFGVRAIKKGSVALTQTGDSLRIRGPYRWVRHPLYFFVLVMIWSHPDLSKDRLLFNIMWTAWIVVGTVLEERDLVSCFGDQYRSYQSEVPMLMPLRIKPVPKM